MTEISTKAYKTITRRRLNNGDHLSITRAIKQNHEFYYVHGKKNYITVQVKILDFLRKKEFLTILETPMEEDYFLAKVYFPLLIETITRSEATGNYRERHSFHEEGEELPEVTTELIIYKDEDKKKYLLKFHGEDLCGLYDRKISNHYLDEEIDLKYFLGATYKEVKEEMKSISQKVFSSLKENIFPDLSVLELEFSFERTKRREGNMEVFSFDVMISDFDIELKDKKNISHKKGSNSHENEIFNKNLLEVIKNKIF